MISVVLSWNIPNSTIVQGRVGESEPESEVFGWSRSHNPKNSKIGSRIFFPTPESK